MRRELPNHPHIDHLKKQAKDLLDAHKRGDADALARIVASLPAFAGRSVEDAARLPFALHDAQSTVAREYGFPSWNELRAEVERRGASASLGAVMPGGLPDSFIRSLAGKPLPAAVTAAMSEAWAARDSSAALASRDLPTELPLVAFRDALLTPGAVAPMMLGRASSLAAIDAALAATPSLIAVFSQREAATEEPSADDLHPVGCVAIARQRVAADTPTTFVVVEGLRWASLTAVDRPAGSGFAVARVAPFHMSEDEGEYRDALVTTLRERAHRLAASTPYPERAAALIDSIRSAQRLSDLVVANLPCPVSDKARYAAEASVARRLQIAIDLCDVQLASAAK